MANPNEVLLGRLAVQRRMLTADELRRVLEEQARRADRVPLGALLIQLGLLTQMQVEELIAAQHAAFAAAHPSAPGTQGDYLLGKRAVETGLLSQEKLNDCLRLQGLEEQRGRVLRLGEVLVQRGLLTAAQVQQLLSAQGKRLIRCGSCGAQFNVTGPTEGVHLDCPRCKSPLDLSTSGPAAAPPPPAPVASPSAEGSFYIEPPAPAPPPSRPVPSGGPAARDTTRRRRRPAGGKARYVDYRSRRKLPSGLPMWVPVVALAAVGILLVANFSSSKGSEPATQRTAEESESPSPSSDADADWRRALAALPKDDAVEAIRRLEAMESSGPLASRARSERTRREQSLYADLDRTFEACRQRSEEAAKREDWDGALTAWNVFPSDLDFRGKYRERIASSRGVAQAKLAAKGESDLGAGIRQPGNPRTPPTQQPPPSDPRTVAAQKRVQEARAAVLARRKAIADEKAAGVARLLDATSKKPIDIDLGGSDLLKGCTFLQAGDDGATIKVSQPNIPAYSVYFSVLKPPVLYQIRSLMTDPADVAGRFALGKYAARLGLYPEAEHEFHWVVGKDASYQTKVPDLAKLKGRGLVFHGSMSNTGWSRYRVTYDFKKPEQSADFAVDRGQVAIDKGFLVLSGQKVVQARLKEIALVEEADLSAEIGPVAKDNCAGWGLELKCADGEMREVYVAKAEGESFMLEGGGGEKLQEKGKLPPDTKEAVHFRLTGGTTLKAFAAKQEVWSETVAPVVSCTVLLLGWGKGDAPINVSFGKLSVEGKFGREWMRKAKKDSEVRALRTLEEDLRLAPDEADRAIAPLSVEGMGTPLSAQEQAEYQEARRTLARRDITYDDVFKVAKTIEDLAERHRDSPAVCYVVAQFCELLGVQDRAVEVLDRAIEAAPRFYEALVLRAQLRVRLKDLPAARRDLDQALAIAPDLAAAYGARGYLRLAERSYADAQDDLELALALDPAETEAVRTLKYVRHLARGPWPKESGKTERVKESEHYRVRTDLDVRKAEAFASRLEKARAVYESMMPPVAANAEKSEVLIFDSEEAYHTYAELTGDDRVESTLGYFHPIYGQLFLFEGAFDASGQETMHVLYHEGFHQYMEPILPFAPTWLSEGLAEYAGGKALEKELPAGKRDPFLGIRLANLRAAMAHGFKTDFATIMDMSKAEFYSGLAPILYAQGWAMCQYFLDAAPEGEKKAFLAYVDLLKKGKEREEARTEAFASYDLKAIERRWRDWVTALKW